MVNSDPVRACIPEGMEEKEAEASNKEPPLEGKIGDGNTENTSSASIREGIQDLHLEPKPDDMDTEESENSPYADAGLLFWESAYVSTTVEVRIPSNALTNYLGFKSVESKLPVATATNHEPLIADNEAPCGAMGSFYRKNFLEAVAESLSLGTGVAKEIFEKHLSKFEDMAIGFLLEELKVRVIVDPKIVDSGGDNFTENDYGLDMPAAKKVLKAEKGNFRVKALVAFNNALGIPLGAWMDEAMSSHHDKLKEHFKQQGVNWKSQLSFEVAPDTRTITMSWIQVNNSQAAAWNVEPNHEWLDLKLAGDEGWDHLFPNDRQLQRKRCQEIVDELEAIGDHQFKLQGSD